MSDAKPAPSPASPRRPLWRRALKAVALSVMALVLFVVGFFAVSLSLLTPERLTPIMRHFASASLQNCRVDVARVAISLRKSYPFFTLRIDSLDVISTAMPPARQAFHEEIPAWADTLFSFREFRGGINVVSLFAGKVVLSDVVLDAPGANIVSVTDSVNNFNIFRPSPSGDDSASSFDIADLPSIRISRIAILRPRPWRYLDCPTATSLTARIDSITLDARTGTPLYALNFNGDVSSPQFMEDLSMRDVRFGLNGDIEWDQRRPGDFAFRSFAFELSIIRGTADFALSVGENLVVDSFSAATEPVAVQRALELIPRRDSIPVLDIETESTLSLSARLLRPFVPARELIPHARIDLRVSDATLRWQRAQFENVGAELSATLAGPDLNKATVDISRLNLRGPATDLTLSGSATSLLDDPAFDLRLDGHCDLSRFPEPVVRLLPGRFSGVLNANASLVGSLSMFSPDRFSELHASGDIALDDFYWLAADTVNAVFARHAVLDFGTDRHFTRSDGQTSGRALAAVLTVDTASVLHHVLDMRFSRVSVGLGAANRRLEPNRKAVIPVGGKVSVGSFSLLSLTDSAMVRVTDAAGKAIIGPHNGDLRTPEFAVDLAIGRLVTGDRSTRLMLRDAQASLTAFREPQGRRIKEISHISDSIAAAHPSLPLDSVYALAVAIHNRHRSPSRASMLALQPDSTEVIDWNVKNSFKRILLGWAFKGDISGRRAALFSPSFPLRNRLSDIDISFNNDSLNIKALRWRAGNSDFRLTGTVNNIRRALTSSAGRQPLRLVLDLVSDTVNINQLAQAVFAGSAYSASADSAAAAVFHSDDEDLMEHAVASAVPDTAVAPFLVPRNVSAELNIRANNVVYSDLLLHNLTGSVLSYQGSLNLNNLSASSAVGSVSLSALYQGRSPSDLKFGFGLRLNGFNIKRFLKMVPAVDSLMPLLRDFGGIVDADIAATTAITPRMDFDLPSLSAAIKLEGDSLVLLDPDTFKSLSKWLMFKNKKDNFIKQMKVQMLVENNTLLMYPFTFDIDRYRLGIMGHNDFALNFDYHIAVLKSPFPFKFGINVRGNPDKFRISLGKARFGDNTPVDFALVDSTRVNLVKEIQNVFRRGIQAESIALRVRGARPDSSSLIDDDLSPADSLRFISVGLLDAPDSAAVASAQPASNTRSSAPAPSSVSSSGAPAAVFSPMAALLTRRRKEND